MRKGLSECSLLRHRLMVVRCARRDMVAKVQQIAIIVTVHTRDKRKVMDRMDCLNETNSEAVGLLTTYRCNLNCKYCYVQTKRDKDMSLDMAKSILEPFLMKKAGRLDITFMGGETLLAIDVIRPLVEWVECGSWNRPYRFFGSTNGTLLNAELKKWLKKYANVLTLGLSYDGLPSAQSYNRGNDNIDLDFFIQT